jgi:hypothetical protein
LTDLGALFQSFVPYAVGAAGALISAWLGFRKGKKERALDRRVVWHERAIEGLASYEEELERLRNHAVITLVNQQTSTARTDKSSATTERNPQLPTRFMPNERIWSGVGEAEQRARSALRLADVYVPEDRLRVECSAALAGTVNLVGGNFFIPGYSRGA